MATYAANAVHDNNAPGVAPHTPTSLSSASPLSAAAPAPADDLARLHVRSSPKPAAQSTVDTSPKAEKPGLSPRTAPLQLTGVAAMAEAKRRNKQQNQQTPQSNKDQEDSRQTSPNPAVAAMQSLMGVTPMSRVGDEPTPRKLSEPMRQVAEKIHLSDGQTSVDSEQVSPTSLTSFGTLEHTSSGHSMTATANDTPTSGPQFVAEPAQMTEGGGSGSGNGNGGGGGYSVNNAHLAVDDQDGNKAFSYPGPPQPDQGQDGGPSRGMSLPGYGQNSPKSPASNKRHKCPYCSTDFTRHHNLKSHLLTHSQEKPYVCQTCQARFRRLHDLKRHTKLHTGERPHTCDKCGRRFARGDALARHNKGPGGCAGRRSSFGGDDEYGPDGTGEGMDGVEYTGHEDDEDGADGNGRRGSEPSRKRQQLETPHDPNREVYRQHSSTYPPAQHERIRGDMGPPTVVHPGSNTATSPRDLSGHPSPGGVGMGSSYYGGGQVFAEPGMITHSPKPLSPGQVPDQHRLSVADGAGQAGLGRNRSTSLTTQFQQAHFGRGSTDSRAPSQPNASFGTGQQGSILPPLGSSGPPHSRAGMPPTAHTASTVGGMMHPQLPPTVQNSGQGSNPGSHSSHGRSSGSSLRDMVGHEQSDIWGYARSLEQRFGRMQDEYDLRLARQQEEIISLKGQMAQLIGSYSSDMGGGQRGPPPYPS